MDISHRIMSRDKEDERKIARRSRSYVEGFFVKSDAVAGHEPKSDVRTISSLFISKEGASWPRGLGYLHDQLRRAMASVVLNLAEGNARKSVAERRRFFEIARGSVIEVAACIDLARAFGLIPKPAAISIKSRLTVISKMLWSLIKR